MLFAEVDGTFPNHHPDPTEEANLADLKRVVAEHGCDFGVASDGDADRLGAVDAKDRVVWGDQSLSILAVPVLAALPSATIIADVKASQMLFDRIAELGGRPLMWKTGHSLIKAKMKETGAPLAGEMSGHIFFKHDWYGFDDGIYAAVRLIDAVSRLGGSLTALKDAMPPLVNTPELRFQSSEARKFDVVAKVLARLAAAGATVDGTDGAQVTTPDGDPTKCGTLANPETKDEIPLLLDPVDKDDPGKITFIDNGEAHRAHDLPEADRIWFDNAIVLLDIRQDQLNGKRRALWRACDRKITQYNRFFKKPMHARTAEERETMNELAEEPRAMSSCQSEFSSTARSCLRINRLDTLIIQDEFFSVDAAFDVTPVFSSIWS